MISQYTLQQTPVQFDNATAGFADASELVGPMVLVLVAALLVIALRPVVPALAQIRVIQRTAAVVGQLLVHALQGVATVGVVGAVVAPIWYVSQMEAGARQATLELVGAGGVVFVGLAVLGYLAEQLVALYVTHHPDAETAGDLLPVDPAEAES